MNKKVILGATALVFSSLIIQSCIPAAVVGTTAVVATSVGQERTAGERIDDNVLVVKIKERFAEADISEYLNKISVNIYEGRVMLTGSVKDQEYKTQAANIVWKVPGVKEVINEIIVSKKDLGDMAKESYIANTIRSKIILEKGIKSNNYIVDANEGTVYILGVAANAAERNKVLEIARSVKGVHQVVNHVILHDDQRRKK